MEIWKPNVVVAAIAEREGKFLLVEEEIEDGRLVFNQPAGHWDPGETLLEACVRETLEETAYVFKPTHLLGVFSWTPPGDDKTYLRFAFCGEAGAHDPARKLDKEIRQALWLSADEIRACRDRHRSPLLMHCIEQYLSGARYPLEVIEHFG
ncbi:MAG TPA: NUDIX hydrolase [Burkholderiales bacterium]|nr:NUDIX hydrolase [Burkholderiales bacterium]